MTVPPPLPPSTLSGKNLSSPWTFQRLGAVDSASTWPQARASEEEEPTPQIWQGRAGAIQSQKQSCVMQCEVKTSVSAEADGPWRKADDLSARFRCRESEETTTDGLQSCRVFSPNPAESNGQGALSSCSIGPSTHPHFTTLFFLGGPTSQLTLMIKQDGNISLDACFHTSLSPLYCPPN